MAGKAQVADAPQAALLKQVIHDAQLRVAESGGRGFAYIVQQVEIEVGGACQAGEIGGESVRIYRSATAVNTFLSRLLNGARRAGRLSVETIEASQIDLEATRAKVVRGRDVRIGADCEIDRVEYSGACEIADGAVVRESAKVSA